MTTGSAANWLAVTEDPLSLEALVAWASRPGCGAVVTFSGTVRDHSDDHDVVEALEYESDEALALARMAELVDEARRRWPALEAVAIHHRLGRVGLGEATVHVVVASAHRAEAFEAARFCIDTLKASVPMWKREHYPGGSSWSSATAPLRPVDAP